MAIREPESTEAIDDDEDTDVDDTTLATVMAHVQELQIRLSIERSKAETASAEVLELKKTLLNNEIFGLQASQELLTRISYDLDKANPPPCLLELPHFHLAQVATLADEFDG